MPDFDIFQKEKDALDAALSLLDAGQQPDTDAFRQLTENYRKLFKHTRSLVRLSDTNERKLRDATERAERQTAELKALQNQLVESEKMAALGQMVAGVAHELNTPIGILLTAATTLQSETDAMATSVASGKIRKSDLDAYFSAAAEASHLIETHSRNAADLVASFKSVAVDRSHDERRDIDLGIFLNDLARSLAPAMPSRMVTMCVDCEDALVISTYPGALGQVMTNLINNAYKHGFADGHEGGTITLTAHASDTGATLQVLDTGRGVSEDILAKIFDPFVTTARGAGGTGLGMNIVYNLVVGKLNGMITIENRTGEQGCLVRLELPKLDESHLNLA